MVGSQYYACCCGRSLNMYMIVSIHETLLIFWFCFISSIGFGFLFFNNNLLLLCCGFEGCVLCNLSR